MNTSLRRIAVTIMALIVLLLANATLTQVFTADGYRADPRNRKAHHHKGVAISREDCDAVAPSCA